NTMEADSACTQASKGSIWEKVILFPSTQYLNLKEIRMDSITIRMPDDFHVHFRRGKVLETVVPHTVRQFGRAMVMPNTNPPILTAKDAVAYRKEIRQCVDGMNTEW